MNALLTSVVNEVYTLTKRPDLANETKLAVKAATLKVHQVSFWERDIVENGIVFSTPAFIQSLEYLTLIPLYRAAKYFRKWDPVTGVPIPGDAGTFDVKTPDSLIDGYGADLDDVYYLAGANINFRSSTEFQYILAGYYVNPDVGDDTYNSWIAVANMYSIVFEAARVIWGTIIGNDSEAGKAEKLYQEQLQLLFTANTVAQGM